MTASRILRAALRALVLLRGLPLLLSLSLSLSLLTAGCDDLDLPPPSRLTYARVVALRAEVADAPERATPAPGETLRLRVLLAGPEPLARVSHAMSICVARPERGQLPACLHPPFMELQDTLADDAAGLADAEGLVVELDVPDDATTADAERLLVSGVVCLRGEARLGPDAAEPGTCEGAADTDAAEGADSARDDDALPVSFVGHVFLEHGSADRNLNPSWSPDALRLSDDVLLPQDADPQVSPSVRVQAGEEEPRLLQIDLSGAGRERTMGEPETLIVSHFATAGSFERLFSALEPDEPDDRTLEVEWRTPRAPRDGSPPPPERVDFVFVLRDDRGGVAFTRRSVAVEPP